MHNSPVIHIENLSKQFGDFAAVKNVSFDVFRGEIFGFLGPNGAGKTTSIRMMLDLLRPTSGKVFLFGEDVTKNSFEIRKKCGYLPGNFSAFNNLTGLEFLHFCADLRQVSRNTDPDLLRRFGLGKQYLQRKIKFLSHGTIQKLGLIQAFSHRPELLILDEPTIGLDPLMQEEFYSLLREYREMGCTIFLSSHNLSEVEKVCQRMAIIREGERVAVDSIENLRKQIQRRIKIELSEPLEAISLTNAELISRDGTHYEFVIHGDLRLILKELSELPLADMTLPEPELEEIFIHFYKNHADA